MIQLVLTVPEPNPPVVCFAAASPDKYYGFVYGSDGFHRGFVVDLGYKTNRYRLMAANRVTQGNHLITYDNTSLVGCLGNALRGGIKIYEFDTPQELFAWVSKTKNNI